MWAVEGGVPVEDREGRGGSRGAHESSGGPRSSRRPTPRESSGPEFVRGAVASLVNVLVTFPAHKAMFRQQLEDVSVRSAVRGMWSEGLGLLFRGVGPPLLQRSLSVSLTFGLYDWYWKRLDVLADREWLRNACSAMLSGTTEALLAPFERVQSILQHRHYNEHFSNWVDCARKLWPYGLREYYRGGAAILLRNGPSTALYFGLRHPCSDALGHYLPDTRAGNTVRSFVSGSLLGATISTLFFPLNVAKAVIQAQIGGPSASIHSTLLALYRERGGLAGVYRGVHLNFARSFVSWGIITSVHDLLAALNFPSASPSSHAPF